MRPVRLRSSLWRVHVATSKQHTIFDLHYSAAKMKGSERHVTVFMFRGLTAELKNLGMMEMSLAAEPRGLGREYGRAVKSC